MPGRRRTFPVQFALRVTSSLTCWLHQKLKTHGKPTLPTDEMSILLSEEESKGETPLQKLRELKFVTSLTGNPALSSASVPSSAVSDMPMCHQPGLTSLCHILSYRLNLPDFKTGTPNRWQGQAMPLGPALSLSPPKLYLMRVFWEIFRGKEFSQWIRTLHVGESSKTWHWIWPLPEERKTKHMQCTPQFPILLPVLGTDLHFSPREDMFALQKTQVLPSGLDLC